MPRIHISHEEEKEEVAADTARTVDLEALTEEGQENPAIYLSDSHEDAISEPTWMDENYDRKEFVSTFSSWANGEKKEHVHDEVEAIRSGHRKEDDIKSIKCDNRHHGNRRRESQKASTENTSIITVSQSQDSNYNFNEENGYHNEEYNELQKPARSPCHNLFIFLTVLTSTTCLSLAIAQLSLLLCAELGPIHYVSTTWMYTILQSFAPIFLVAFYFIEFEIDAPWVLMGSTSLGNWAQRGFVYAFFGLFLMEEHGNIHFDFTSSSSSSAEREISKDTGSSQQSPSSDNLETYTIFVKLMSMILFGFSRALLCEGMAYFVLGVTCMRGVRDKCRESYADRLESYYDMKRLMQQRGQR